MEVLKDVKNIIFDLGQVVLPLSIESSIAEFKKLGIANGFEDTLCTAATSEIFDAYETGKITSEIFVEEMHKYCEASDTEIINAWNAMLLDFDTKRIDLLKELSRNHKIFLLSNTNALHYDYFAKKFYKEFGYKFDSLFTKAYYSHVMGLRKPDPKIFQTVLNEQGLIAKETLFLDDNLTNLECAKNLGINIQHITKEYTIVDYFRFE